MAGFWNADSDRDWDDEVHLYDEPKSRRTPPEPPPSVRLTVDAPREPGECHVCGKSIPRLAKYCARCKVAA